MLPKIIVFTGIDGSGKTTQARILTKYLQKRDIAVSLVQQFAPNKLIKIILKNTAPFFIKMERNASNKTYFNRENSTNQSFLKSVLRMCALTRIVCMGFTRTWVKLLLNVSSSIIVSDRYFYDDIIKAKWMYGISNRFDRMLMCLVPKPFILFNLDILPEKAWKRETDGNTTLEQHRIKKEMYDEWFERIKKKYKNFYIVNAEKEIVDTHFEIVNLLEASDGEK